MAAYNAGPFLAEALDSVLAQTFSDYEIIVSDDGSSDDTSEVAQAYARRHPERIQVVRGEQNAGKSVALNRALARRRGELIAWLDADDVMLPTKLERQVAVLAEDAGAAGVVHDAEMFQSETGAVIGRFSEVANGARLRPGGVELWFDPTYRMLPSATMIRSGLCPPGGFDERLRFTNDWLFDIEIFRQGRCRVIDDVLVRYRRHADNFSTRATNDGTSFEEGMMAMALVAARHPELARRARTMRTALLLGQARDHAARRQRGEALRYGRAALTEGGPGAALSIGGQLLRARARRRHR